MRRPCEHLKPAIGVSYMRYYYLYKYFINKYKLQINNIISIRALGNVSNNYINAGKQIAFKSLDVYLY